MQIRFWSWEAEEKQPSGVKTPLLEGRLIAGVETPDCCSGADIVPISQVSKARLVPPRFVI